MKDKEGAVKAAIFSGIFVVLAACVTGGFLLINTLLEQGIVVVGPGVQIGNPQSESATSTPTSTVATYPTPRPANSISREEVRQLNFGQVSIDEVNNCLAQAHAGPRPFVSFSKGDTIPATTLIATDFGGGGVTYDQLPDIPVCHNGSWGLFESQESFTAPHEGAYWFIVP